LRSGLLRGDQSTLENSLGAMRIHGAAGCSREYPIERYYRDAPLLCIGEGTNEIQRLIIAKRLLARSRSRLVRRAPELSCRNKNL
jgi:alkylation response protein AidB-like acyl-CoA dehydrogenase